MADESADRFRSVLTATTPAGPFLFHVEPGGRSESELPEFVRRYVDAARELERRMAMTFRGPVQVWVYRDAAQLQSLTGVPGAGGFASPGALHVTWDLPPHHELTHQFCIEWNAGPNRSVPEDGPPTRMDRSVDGFVVEGLAEAMTPAGPCGIPKSDWVALAVRLGAKPDLVECRERWMTWPDAVNAYWLAGSVMEYLLERYGIPSVKRWYHRREDDREIFGRAFDVLAAEWHEWISARPVDLDRFADAVPQAVRFTRRLTGVKGSVRMLAAANEWFVISHNGREMGGGWAWWMPRVFDIGLTGDDRFDVLALNSDGFPGFWLECAPPGGGEPVMVSGTDWEATIRGRRSGAGLLEGGLPWASFWSDEGRARSLAIRGRRIWALTPSR